MLPKIPTNTMPPINDHNKPVLKNPSGSDSGLDYYPQGGVVRDGVAYFTSDRSCSAHWKAEGFPFGVAFDVDSFDKIRSYPFKDTYDSCPMVVDTSGGRRLVVAHEWEEEHTRAVDGETGRTVWTSPRNQPERLFFGYSVYYQPNGSTLLYLASKNGLHAINADNGKEVWWHRENAQGGVTPCVNQEDEVVYYQADAALYKLNAESGQIINKTSVPYPNTSVSWNTVFVDDTRGKYIATYWFAFHDENGNPIPREERTWVSAVRVYNPDLQLVWSRTGLPAAKKTTLTCAHGKVVIGTGGHWGAEYTGTSWKYLEAYSIDNGDVVWHCDLTDVEYDGIINVPYAYGYFFAECWGKTGKLLRINATDGKLEQILDYEAPIGSCAPCLIAHGKMLSGDLERDGIVATELARGCDANWPGPFGDPQTNTYALPDDADASIVTMREL